jgi:hypothetical protein
MPDEPAAILDQIREHARYAVTIDDWHQVGRDARVLVGALEAVLKLGDRSGETQDPHLPGYVDVHMIREAITRELAGKDAGDGA